MPRPALQHYLAIHAERERGQRSGSLPSLARDPWETVKFESRGEARVPRETWEGLNVAPAPSLRVLQGSGGEQVEACEKQRQFDENQQKYG